ncbi:MAG: hypothetical protein NUV51_04570 [Sulfuricaulis sp.]|nr:hypothetical protein [Sulfuricaulis sp.]
MKIDAQALGQYLDLITRIAAAAPAVIAQVQELFGAHPTDIPAIQAQARADLAALAALIPHLQERVPE